MNWHQVLVADVLKVELTEAKVWLDRIDQYDSIDWSEWSSHRISRHIKHFKIDWKVIAEAIGDHDELYAP